MTAQIEVHHDDSLNPGSFSQVKGGGRVSRLTLPVFMGALQRGEIGFRTSIVLGWKALGSEASQPAWTIFGAGVAVGVAATWAYLLWSAESL